MNAARKTSLLIALGCLVAALASQFCWAGHPEDKLMGAVGFVIASIAAVIMPRLSRGREPLPSPRWSWPRFLRDLSVLTGLLILLRHLVVMNAHSAVVWFAAAPWAASGVFAVEFLIIGLEGWRAHRSRRSTLLAIGLTTLLFALGNCAIYPVLGYLKVFSPPSASDCETMEQEALSHRLTPEAWPSQGTVPYRMAYVREADRLIVAYKMMGNREFWPWTTQDANRLVVIDGATSDEPRATAHPLEGPELPENLLYLPELNAILVTRSANDIKESRVELYHLDDSSRLTLKATYSAQGDPDDLIAHPDGRRVAVFFTDGSMETLNLPDLVPRGRQHVINGFVDHVWHLPDSTLAYASTVGQQVFEVDIESGATRRGLVLFGGGEVGGTQSGDRIFVADQLFGALNVLHTESMRNERLSLPRATRALTVDNTRQVVAIGELLSGAIHLVTLESLEPIDHETLSGGPFLRFFAYDETSGSLFTSSKCGVHRVDVSRLIQTASLKFHGRLRSQPNAKPTHTTP